MAEMPQEVKAAVRATRLRAPIYSRWVHRKSRYRYIVRDHVVIEATLEPAVVYLRVGHGDHDQWCRPASEFFDGRFVRVDAPDV